MSRQGPILIAEDDMEDRHILREVFESLQIKNELRFFDNGQQVLDYLQTTKEHPLIIISDVNLPLMSGTRLRQEMNKDERLRKKSIPFVFLTTNMDAEAVNKAYDMMVQGYFLKENNLRQVVKLIIDYWCTCRHPDKG